MLWHFDSLCYSFLAWKLSALHDVDACHMACPCRLNCLTVKSLKFTSAWDSTMFSRYSLFPWFPTCFLVLMFSHTVLLQMGDVRHCIQNCLLEWTFYCNDWKLNTTILLLLFLLLIPPTTILLLQKWLCVGLRLPLLKASETSESTHWCVIGTEIRVHGANHTSLGKTDIDTSRSKKMWSFCGFWGHLT